MDRSEDGFRDGTRVPTFAIRFGRDPYGFIARFQAFNGNGKAAGALARELFDAYRNNSQTRLRMGEVVIGLFEESNTFAEAKTRVGYLEDLDSWDASFSDRIQSAARDNSQISGSWGVRGRVEALLRKWAK